MSVFDPSNKSDHIKSLAFLDPNGGVTIQRYDTVKYKAFDKLTETQMSFFWIPSEIDLTKDANDFKLLSQQEKHIVISNIKRQILLDSVQGRSPNLAFLPIVCLPEIEAFITAWAFSESVHSRSYTHIIRQVFNNPKQVFDEMMDIEEIIVCAKDISANYDLLIDLTTSYHFLGEGTHNVNDKSITVDLYEIKKALWMTIMSVNILEGVRFYGSFACSWAFAENKTLESVGKIIKLIARDEALHLAATQMLLKILPRDDPDFVKIAAETENESINLFRSAAQQEKDWAHYLFKNGSIIGLNEELLCDYVEWITNKRLSAVGLPTIFKTGSNPLPWTQKWIAGSDVQTAPQETQITSYILGGTSLDVTEDTFKGFSL